MNTTSLPLIFLLFFLLCSLSLQAQYDNWSEYEASEASSSFDQHLQASSAAIAVADPRAALQHLDKARDEAVARKDKDLKNKAREAQRRVKSFYSPFFRSLAEGRAAFGKQEWKNAQMAFESARELVEEYRRKAFPEFAEVDRQLTARADQELSLAVQQRQYLVREQLRRAEQLYHSGAFEPALEEAATAKALLIEDREQAQLDRLNQLERQIHYDLHFGKGDQAVQDQQLEEALLHYEEAEKHLAGHEVTARIKEVKNRLHYQLLQEGQEAFFAGQYEAAAQKLEAAAGFQHSNYLQRIRENAYNTLRQRGQTALDNGDQETSTQLFLQASRFTESDAIQNDIRRAKAYGKHEKHLQKGLSLLEHGKVKKARRQLVKAAKYMESPVIDQQLADIDKYYTQLSAGKEQLKMNPSRAWQTFLKAQQQFDTKKVRQYLEKAKEAAGGVVGADSGEIFFN